MRRALFVLVVTSALACSERAETRRPPPAPPAAPPSSERPEGRLAEIDAILEAQRRELHLPGLALVVVKGDRIVYLKTLGLRDVERGLPVTADTLFPVGSCTKAFTSMAVALGQDQGVLSLDDHPRKFLPYFKMADPEADANVTLRDMLGHRTGLRAYADLAAEPAVLTREEYVRAAAAAKPAVKFRAAFQYSNAMYAAAGEIVGKAKGSTWERVVKTEIFDRLGMTSSVVTLTEMVDASDHATGYVTAGEGGAFRPVPPPRSLGALAPGGSVASTPRDLALWVRMLSAGGRFGGRRFVSEGAFRELTTAQIAISPQLSYALGWGTYEWQGLRVVEHNGGSTGISALVSFIPERGAGFVFLANTSPNFMTKMGNAGKLLWPLILGEGANAKGPPAAAEGAPSSAASPPAGSTAPAPPEAGLPSVDELLARMVRAVGGERALKRHGSLAIVARKSYENQGVSARLEVRAKAPAMRDEREVWTAAGKTIGQLRLYFDGARGGQETTFGQDELNDEAANAQARREGAFRGLLELKRLYKEVRVASRTKVGAEDAYLLELVPERGRTVSLAVSARSALVLKREAGGEAALFEDYRSVDGELIPFRTIIRDALGETSIRVEEARFNVAVPEGAFAPAVKPPG